jgi:hypothetical protein
MSETSAPFRVLRVRDAPFRPDGTRRSTHIVDVEVDGVIHEVRIRQSGRPHLPQALIGHPRGAEIKESALQAVLGPMLRRIEEHRKAGRLPRGGDTTDLVQAATIAVRKREK